MTQTFAFAIKNSHLIEACQARDSARESATRTAGEEGARNERPHGRPNKRGRYRTCRTNFSGRRVSGNLSLWGCYSRKCRPRSRHTGRLTEKRLVRYSARPKSPSALRIIATVACRTVTCRLGCTTRSSIRSARRDSLQIPATIPGVKLDLYHRDVRRYPGPEAHRSWSPRSARNPYVNVWSNPVAPP